MSFDICTLWNHYHNQHNIFSKSFSKKSLCNSYFPLPKQPLIWFLSLLVSLHFLEFCINRTTETVLSFGLASFTRHNCFVIHPCCSFLCTAIIPSYMCTHTFFIHSSVVDLDIFSIWLLQIKLPWSRVDKLYGHTLSVLLGKHLGVGWLGRMAGIMLNF